jgi:LacI family transcriptional regulator
MRRTQVFMLSSFAGIPELPDFSRKQLRQFSLSLLRRTSAPRAAPISVEGRATGHPGIRGLSGSREPRTQEEQDLDEPDEIGSEAGSLVVAVTLKQVAEHAGQSLSTASRILNNEPHLFKQETREKVIHAARVLGYRPALRSNRLNAIGLLLADPNRQILPDSLHWLLRELHARNQHLMIGEVPDESDDRNHNGISDDENGAADGDDNDTPSPHDRSVPKLLREWAVDGLLIYDGGAALADPPLPRRMMKLIRRNRVPTIWLNTRCRCDCVYADYHHGAREATQRLLRLGHRRTLFIDLNDDGARTHTDRRGGYESAAHGAGVTPHTLVAYTPASERATLLAQCLREHRGRRDAPTAILCAQPATALPLYLAAMKARLSIPRDLSILTMHDPHREDEALLRSTGTAISNMRLPAFELAREGLRALDAKMERPRRPLPPRALRLVYNEGMTVAPPP